MKAAAILVEGTDARKFLQGQLTCDMNELTADHPLRGAHCNTKGRVEALYDIYQQGDQILLVTPEDVIQHALEKLQFYARFSKVTLSVIPTQAGIQIHRPCLHPETIGRFLPQEMGVEPSLTKGCYLGQEIVARVHYLGKLKKEFLCIDTSDLQGSDEIVDKDESKIWVLRFLYLDKNIFLE